MENLFSQLPDTAKVWIYQSSRAFSETETQQLNQMIEDFVTSWSSHSRKVTAQGEVLYHRFIVLAADESAFNVSGCSIDSSIHFIQQLEAELQVKLFDRLQVASLHDNQIQVAPQAEIRKKIQEGSFALDTIIFNNLVGTLGEFRSGWQIPVAESWIVKGMVKVGASGL